MENLETMMIPVDLIVPDPNQPRKTFTLPELEELGNSMKAEGQKTPIVVFREDEKFKLVCGERRLRAAIAVGIPELRAEIDQSCENPKSAYKAQLIENTVRDDLPPMDQAQSYRDALLREMDMEEIAEAVGKSVSSISKAIEMAGIQDPTIRRLINEKIIPITVAQELATFSDKHIRTAWDWASKKTSADGMKKQLDAYRQKLGQMVFNGDYDYTKKKDDLISQELEKAATAFSRWEKSTKTFIGKIHSTNGNRVKLEHAIHARTKDIAHLLQFSEEVTKLAKMLKDQVGACDSKINGKNPIAVNA